MPIYEYRCKACGKEFETLVRNAQDEEELACPKCGARDVGRQLSVFTGSAGAGGTASAAPSGSCAPRGGGFS